MQRVDLQCVEVESQDPSWLGDLDDCPVNKYAAYQSFVEIIALIRLRTSLKVLNGSYTEQGRYLDTLDIIQL